MAISLIGVVQPALETSNTTTHSITTPASVVAGDFLILFLQYPSGTATNSLTTNPANFIKLGDSTVSGVTSTVYYKQNAQPGDSSQVTTATLSSSLRTTKIIAQYRGVTSTGTPFGGYASRQASARTTYDSPVVTATAAGIRLEYAAWSVTGQVANSGKTIPDLTAAPDPASGSGLTKIAAHWTGSVVTTGNAEAVLAHNLTPVAAGASVGGTFWTPETAATAGNATIWTIVLLPVVVSVSARPTGVVSATGYVVYGGTPTIDVALADELDTSGAESADNPSASFFEVSFPDVLAQDTISLLSRLEVIGTGSVSYLISIRQGATVICSKTRVVAVSDGIVDDVLLSTTTEAAAISVTSGAWSNLRARWTETAV